MQASARFAIPISAAYQRLLRFLFAGLLVALALVCISSFTHLTPPRPPMTVTDHWRRPECSCTRAVLPPVSPSSIPEQKESQSSLCSPYATRRGPHQRTIAISLFGPKENALFQMNTSLRLLQELIVDFNAQYSDNFILRVYHDGTVDMANVICPIECEHANVDFCSVQETLFIPPKIWRFIPAGDPLVDTMMSRDLDSALTKRERDAVNAWFASNKTFHTMRDNPQHGVPMLGGMWGFRPSLNREAARLIHEKIHNEELIKRYGGRGDQTFLSDQVWPMAKSSAIAHDSFLCANGYGLKPEAFPTQRPSANETNCFIGCVRPCCGQGKMPFGECPKACRPPDHPEWLYC